MIQQINLIDPALRVTRDWLGGRRIAGVAAALGLLVGAHWAYEQTLLTRTIAASAATAPAADPAASAPTASADELQLQETQRVIARGERLMQAVSGLTDLPRHNAQRLRSLISAMPDNLWLQEVEFSGERGVRVAGGTTDAAALTSFAQRLGAQRDFQGVPLFVFKVEPRAAPQREGDTEPAADARLPHYAFVLSTSDAEATR